MKIYRLWLLSFNNQDDDIIMRTVKFSIATIFLCLLLLINPANATDCANMLQQAWYAAFGLSDDDTVRDYNMADINDRVRYTTCICYRARCLNRFDNICGIYVDTYPASDCFHDIIQKVSPDEKIGNIAKYCGIMTSKIDPYSLGPRAQRRCKKFGGIWGERSNPPNLKWK